MKHKDLKIGLKVNFIFAGSNHTGKIMDFKQENKHNIIISRYLIEDKEGFKYPVAIESILKVIK